MAITSIDGGKTSDLTGFDFSLAGGRSNILSFDFQRLLWTGEISMRRACIVLIGVGTATLVASGPAHASIFKKIGHAIGSAERSVGHAAMSTLRGAKRDAVEAGDAAGNGTKAVVRFVNKEAAKPVAQAAFKYTGKALDAAGTGLDHFGNLAKDTPILGAAAPLVHDVAKAVNSPAAHWGAAAAAGLVVGGGALNPMVAGGAGSTAAGRVAFAAGSGGMAGYYGRQVYLGARCIDGPTKTCQRLQSKP